MRMFWRSCHLILFSFSRVEIYLASSTISRASLVAQMVKNLPAIWETWIWSPGWEDPLEKGMATDYSILAWTVPRTEEPGRLQSMVSQRVGYDWATSLSLFFCLFVFHLMGRGELVILSADDSFVCLFCLLFRWGILNKVLLVVGWWWVFYSSGFLCVSSHYLILPKVSSLVI